jgi:hypothetical protein
MDQLQNEIIRQARSEVLRGKISIHKKITVLYKETNDRKIINTLLKQLKSIVKYTDVDKKVLNFTVRNEEKIIKFKKKTYPSLIMLQNKIDEFINTIQNIAREQSLKKYLKIN